MASLGFKVTAPVSLVLRPVSELRARGLFDPANPDMVGVTQWQGLRFPGRKLLGSITIGIVAGLPENNFRLVLAHEYAHALMAGWSHVDSLSPRIVEGFAEALAVEHTTQLADRQAAKRLRDRALQNPDPVYGDGVRLVHPAVQRYGVARVLKALKERRPERVGLR